MRLLKLRSVLVASDLDDASRSAIRTAARLVQLADAEIHLVHVAAHLDAHTEKRLVEHFRASAPDGREPDSVSVLPGSPAETIAKYARTVGADTLVMGPHRGDGEFGVLGSTAVGVVRDAPCPCLVAASELRLPIERVLVPIDLSDVTEQALAVALTWASALRSRNDHTELIVLHVIPASDAEAERALRDRVDDARNEATAFGHIDVREQVSLADDPASEILRCARSGSTDLLVVGTRRADGASSRLGSVSATVARGASCPLLLVPPSIAGARD